MIISLFSIFDPTAIISIPINWLLILRFIVIWPFNIWNFDSRISILTTTVAYIINKEFKSLFSKNILIKGSSFLPTSLFILILFNNLVRNFPYTFCTRAHLVFSLTLSVPIWTSLTIFYWITLTKSMLAHLVPTGTPTLLIPLIVIIEITRNFIRPTALAVRLTANLIAGHLLIALLGNTFNPSSIIWIIILIIQTLFLTFELIVAIIQSYVFSVLITLYSREIS